LTVYVKKKGHFKKKQRKFREKRFVVTEFVKTCDELVIDLGEVPNGQEPVFLEEAVIVMEMLQILLKLNRLWSIMTRLLHLSKLEVHYHFFGNKHPLWSTMLSLLSTTIWIMKSLLILT
jgi:hypothetical protein